MGQTRLPNPRMTRWSKLPRTVDVTYRPYRKPVGWSGGGCPHRCGKPGGTPAGRGPSCCLWLRRWPR
jgi:hypothetical protein